MSITKEQLEDHIKNGLISDIFKMERSYFLLKQISENADKINKTGNGNYGELFGSLQNALNTESILAVARLYDKPNNRYPMRCIRGLLSFLEENADNLPEIQEKYNLVRQLNNMEVPEEIVSLVGTNDSVFTLAFAGYYRGLLDDDVITENVERLKTLRDKTLAHNEMVSTIDGPTWGGLEKLIELSKDLAGVLGWAFLNTAYVHDGEYFLSSDAERPALAIYRLFNEIYSN